MTFRAVKRAAVITKIKEVAANEITIATGMRLRETQMVVFVILEISGNQSLVLLPVEGGNLRLRQLELLSWPREIIQTFLLPRTLDGVLVRAALDVSK